MSLLDNIKSQNIEVKSRKRIGREYSPKERAEIVIAWFHGEISLRQISLALGKSGSPGSCSHLIGSWAKEAFDSGYLVEGNPND